MIYLADRLEAERLIKRKQSAKSGYVLPEGSGPGDFWLAVIMDPKASTEARLMAARAFAKLPRRSQEEAQLNREAMLEWRDESKNSDGGCGG